MSAASSDHGHALAEAEQRVAFCLRKGRDHLNLVGLGLHELPADFRRLTGLRYLDLTDNALEACPAAISTFAELRRLGLNGNRLATLDAGLQNSVPVAFVHELRARDGQLKSPRGDWSGPGSQPFGRREGQPTFATEELSQAAVLRTAGAADDSWSDLLARLATRSPAPEPILPTDRSVNRDGRDLGV